MPNVVSLGNKVTGTGTVVLQGGGHLGGGTLGGFIITTNQSDDAVVQLRRNNASGKVLLDISTKQGLGIFAPIDLEGTVTIYFSVTGTGAELQLFEWVI